MKAIGIIPARYKSSRYEGKPLIDINGKPMIWWVYQQAKNASELSEVYVATDDIRIEKACEELQMNVIMTSSFHLSGTDRACEVAEKIKADFYTIVMGDEPLILSKDIDELVRKMKSYKSYSAGLLAKKYANPVDIVNPTTIKLALNKNEELIYMSRVAIPFPKSATHVEYYKNIGVYVFSAKALQFFGETPVGKLESVEDLEMLRMLENHKTVKVHIIDSDSYSVDTPKDLERVKNIFKNRANAVS